MADEPIITIEDLSPVTPGRLHQLVGILAGASGRFSIQDIFALLEASDIADIVNDVIASGDEISSMQDDDLVLTLSDGGATPIQLSNLIATIFKSTRTIPDARFAAATFRLLNAAGTPKELTFDTSALTSDRTIIMPNANVNLGNIVAPDIKAWANINMVGTPSIIASKNVSSITDNGVGDITVNFATPLADANYILFGSGQSGSLTNSQTVVNVASASTTSSPTLKTTSACRIIASQAGAGGPADYANLSVGFIR